MGSKADSAEPRRVAIARDSGDGAAVVEGLPPALRGCGVERVACGGAFVLALLEGSGDADDAPPNLVVWGDDR